MYSLRTTFAFASLAMVLTAIPRSAESANVVPFEAEWLHYTPQSSALFPGANFENNWFQPNFDTSTNPTWLGPSPAPFAFGKITAFDPGSIQFIRPLGTELVTPPSGDRLTSYFRHNFTTTEELTSLGMDLLMDDGGKIYIDGEQILNIRCCNVDGIALLPDDPDEYAATATANGNERDYSRHLIDMDALAPGDHVLAVSVHNRSATDNDLGFNMSLFSGVNRHIESGSTWQYFKGTGEPSGGTTDWTLSGFDDTSWDTGQDGFGYEADANSSLPDLINTELDDMQDAYLSLYLRQGFTVENPQDVGELTVWVDYDDSFFAYINGELAFSTQPNPDRDDPTAAVPFDWTGASSHESTNGGNGLPLEFTVSLADFPGLLNAGENTLAIQAFNSGIGSSDFFVGQIAVVSVPGEGPIGVAGDFDNSGVLDAPDIDDLTAQSASGASDATYDLNDDTLVNSDDVKVWIEDLFNSWVGDLNLDLEFNSTDLTGVLASGKYDTGAPAVWSEGDFNGDGVADSSDLTFGLAGGGYELGPKTVSAVPEPSGLLLLVLAMIGVVPRSKNRRR